MSHARPTPLLYCASLGGLTALAALGSAGCGTTARSLDAGPTTPTIEYVEKQEILTPLPLRVRLPASMNVEHLVVLYRTWGSKRWSAMELERSGQTWTGEVSCREVSTVTGDTKYYFVGLDDDGNVVAGSGSPSFPHVATIVSQLEGGAQSLPDGWMPLRCHDVADCPPDFPGCPAYSVRRHACRSDDDCGGGRCAWDGYCGPASEDEAMQLESTGDEELDAAVKKVRRRFAKNR